MSRAAYLKGVDGVDVVARGVGKDGEIGGEQRCGAVAGGRDDEAVGGIAREGAGQPHAVDGDRGVDRDQSDTRQGERRLDPRAGLAREAETAPIGQQGDLPRRDGGDADSSVRPLRRRDGGARIGAEPPVAVQGPDQHMRVEHDHRMASHSAGSAAGRKGSS